MMDELVAGLAQQHKPILREVVVVSGVHMMDIEVAHTFVLYTAKLAGHIARST